MNNSLLRFVVFVSVFIVSLKGFLFFSSYAGGDFPKGEQQPAPLVVFVSVFFGFP